MTFKTGSNSIDFGSPKLNNDSETPWRRGLTSGRFGLSRALI